MALGVDVPELDTEATAGRFGTELALGKLQLGDPGVGEAMEINEGVAVFCGVPRWSISPGIEKLSITLFVNLISVAENVS